MNNNPWITDRKPTEYDADPCENVEVAFAKPLSCNSTLQEKLGVQIYNERHYWKKVAAGMISRPWRHTPEWIDKTSVDRIKQELNEKFDKIEKDYLEKSRLSKAVSFQKHSDFGKRQDQAFETAKKTGKFPVKVLYYIDYDKANANSILVSSCGGPIWDSRFAVNKTNKSKGYWWIKPDLRIYSEKKPNVLIRQIAKLFDLEWIHE